MIKNGFDIRRETDATWAVIDAFKGEPVAIKGHLQVGLTEAEAKTPLITSVENTASATTKAVQVDCPDAIMIGRTMEWLGWVPAVGLIALVLLLTVAWLIERS